MRASSIPRRPPRSDQRTPRGNTQLRRDVCELPEKLQRLVRQMLIEGATIEDTHETLNEQPDGSVTFQAIQNFYRSRLDLQAERLKRQLETARTLKRALGNSRSGMNQLADAIFMTGFMGVRNGLNNFGVVHSMKERLERENLRLKKNLMILKRKTAAQDLEYARARTRLIHSQRAKLQSLLRPVEQKGKLDPEAYRQIREIYGLLAQPGAETSRENPTSVEQVSKPVPTGGYGGVR